MADRQKLSDPEWEIMKILWEHGPQAARDIFAHLKGSTDWSYSTMKTYVHRMVGKGWLKYEQIGNSYLYRPAVGKNRAVRKAIEDFSGRVLDGVLTPFVAYFAEKGSLTSEDIEQLENIVKRHKTEGGT